MASMLIDSLHIHRSNMSRTETIILDQLLQDPGFFVRSSAREFSKAIGVSDASIMRFCTKYSHLGYQQFKLTLNQQLIDERQPTLDPVVENLEIYVDDTLAETINKVESTVVQGLLDIKSNLDLSAIQQVVARIEQSRRQFLMGTGGSSYPAGDYCDKLNRIGYDATFFEHSSRINYKMPNSTPDDVVIALSHSGETIEVVSAVETARQNGTYTVALVGTRDSMLADLADVVFLTSSAGKLFLGDSIGTRVSQLFILDVLFSELVKHSNNKARLSTLQLRVKDIE